MIITKKIGLSVLTVIVAMAAIASFSSFKGDPVKPTAKKAVVVKANHALVKPANAVIYFDYYWNGSSWQNTPYVDCIGNGVVCSVGFNNTAAGYTIAQMCNDAAAAWAASGNLANPAITSGSIIVHGKSCFVTERGSE